MMRPHLAKIGTGLNHPGFTLVEAVISTLVVGVMFVAAMSTLAASKVSQHKVSLTSRGQLLAETLMAEILNQAYEEPQDTVDFGPESGESTGDRMSFDDVDDYHAWSASPPVDRNGTVLVDSTRWRRKVVVQWVSASDPSTALLVEANVKRIIVTVTYDNIPRASLAALKTVHGQESL